MYHDAEHNFEYNGIKVDGLSYDWDKMMDAKSKAITGLTQGIEGLFKKNKVAPPESNVADRQYLKEGEGICSLTKFRKRRYYQAMALDFAGGLAAAARRSIGICLC